MPPAERSTLYRTTDCEVPGTRYSNNNNTAAVSKRHNLIHAPVVAANPLLYARTAPAFFVTNYLEVEFGKCFTYLAVRTSVVGFSAVGVNTCTKTAAAVRRRSSQVFLGVFLSFCRAMILIACDEDRPSVRNSLILLPDPDCVGGGLGRACTVPGLPAGRVCCTRIFAKYIKYVSCEFDQLRD